MPPGQPSGPSWDRLFEVAVGQEGLFTTQQAAEAGYSPQLLIHHMRAGRVRRIRRSIYRLVHFPDYDAEYSTKPKAIEMLVRAYSEGQGPVEGEDDDDDDEEDDYEPSLGLDEERRSFNEELARPVERREERPYQREAVAAAERALKKPGARVQLHIATGGGKTHIANEVVRAELARGGRVLWVTKDWTLLRQAALDLGRGQRLAPELGRIGGGHHALRVLQEGTGRVRYTTLHTLSRRKAKAFRGFSPTVAVWDECHWGVDGTIGTEVLRLLEARNVPVLGLTATPKQGSGFEVIYRKTFAELKGQYLAEPIIEEPVRTSVRVRARLNAFNDLDNPTLCSLADNPGRNRFIVDHWIANSAKYDKTMVFACFVKHADNLARDFTARGISGWAELAEVLRGAVRQVLPTELVATRLTPTYTGIDGGKDHAVWNFERDPTAGWEVTSAVLEGPQGFDQVARVTRALESVAGREGFKVNWRTGTHVHIGWRDDSRPLGIRALKRLIQLVKLLEPALATLVSPSRIRRYDGTYHMDAPNEFCEPMATRFPKAVVDDWTSTEAFWKFVDGKGDDQRLLRYVTLNLLPLRSHNTVEVRLHNGTLDSSKLALWLSLWQQILWAAEGDRPIEEAEERRLLTPDGDIVALAERCLVDPRLPEQRRLLHRLDARRREVAEVWRSRPEFAAWCNFADRWKMVQ